MDYTFYFTFILFICFPQQFWNTNVLFWGKKIAAQSHSLASQSQVALCATSGIANQDFWFLLHCAALSHRICFWSPIIVCLCVRILWEDWQELLQFPSDLVLFRFFLNPSPLVLFAQVATHSVLFPEIEEEH